MRWPAVLLLLVLCGLQLASAACPTNCPNGRVLISGGPEDTGYCTIDFTKNCTNQHTECSSCFLYKTDCQSLTYIKKCDGFGRNKKNGYYLDKDEKCAGGKYKIIASQALTGVESALNATTGAARDQNYLFQQLWLSSLPGATNPCGSVNYRPFPASGSGVPRTGAMQNAAAYRSQHQWHAHVGAAKTEFEQCVEKVAPTATARRKFVPGACDFTWTNSGGTSSHVETVDVWLYLEPASSTTAAPPDMATVVQKAGRPAGPIGQYVKADPNRKLFTGVAVMGIEWARAGTTAAPKPHFAVLVYNYHDAWAKAKGVNKFFQLGEYELLVHT